ncbi:MAG: PIG-L family deacetylase [Caldilineaceae bacterium]|nr:PIG-L family deacetylase [Caldilineaceae bacterium]
MMRIVEPPVVASVMAIAAHPDDIESWCAGTLARFIDVGATARLLLVTSGDLGSNDPHATQAGVAAQREAETQQAAMALGLSEVIFLRHPDGNVENTQALRGELVAWIRRWQPQALFTHDPEHPLPPYIAHRDHRIVGRAALDAVYPLARDRLAFAEQLQAGLMPHVVQEVWLFASSLADAYVDITTGFERKLAARLAHVSQTPDPVALVENWRRRVAEIGEPAGLALAEAFTILTLDM